MLGVTVSERLRTFGGKLFRLSQHLRRLDHSLEIVGVDIGLNHAQLTEIAERLVAHNRALLDEGDDLGLVLFASPGSPAAGRPTLCLYTDPLPFGQWAELYERGQPLAIVDVRQVPATCWPPELKCRSRMHYYLADREAARKFPGSRAVLLDQEGYVSEASTANVLVVHEGEGLVSPPERRILPGVTLGVNEELAAAAGIPFARRDLTAEDLRDADELLLCSTSPCIWPALEIDGRAVGNGRPGPVLKRLLAAWRELVGIDLPAQAARFRSR
jgi:branched-subunit amino acid aminotransferase/4-amino-4-deoxychorismate lyase